MYVTLWSLMILQPNKYILTWLYSKDSLYCNWGYLKRYEKFITISPVYHSHWTIGLRKRKNNIHWWNIPFTIRWWLATGVTPYLDRPTGGIPLETILCSWTFILWWRRVYWNSFVYLHTNKGWNLFGGFLKREWFIFNFFLLGGGFTEI